MNDTQSQLTSPCKLCGEDIGFEPTAEDAVTGSGVRTSAFSSFAEKVRLHSKCATEYQQSNQKGKQ